MELLFIKTEFEEGTGLEEKIKSLNLSITNLVCLFALQTESLSRSWIHDSKDQERYRLKIQI